MDKIITDESRIDEILSKGVEDVISREETKTALLSGRQLRIKFGIDPTGPKIHIGRAIPLRKLREFQRLGHKIVLIIGDFTAQIGDASDKSEKRPMLNKSSIDENLQDYKSQLGKILDMNKVEFVYNGDWLSQLTFSEITKMSECFSVQQMLSRRNFKDRFENGVEISLREFLYPLMQGYDSVAVKSDIEIGGYDQLFNLKAGRTLQDFYGQSKQNIMVCEMLEGTDGRKMSTSYGNTITVVDSKDDMYGSLMSVNDELIFKYMKLCTDMESDEIEGYRSAVDDGGNPRDAKMKLAFEVVKLYHGDMDAVRAQNSFVETFQKGGIPDVIDEYHVAPTDEIGDIMTENKLVESKSEWRRLVEQNAVSVVDGEIVTDFKMLAVNGIYKIGKKRFVRLIVI